MTINNISYRKGAISSSLLSVFAKGIAFIQQLGIAYFCGVNITTDIHFYLYNLAILIGGMIQLITSSILIPRAMELRHTHLQEMKFLNSFGILLLCIGVPVLLLLGICGQYIMCNITQFNIKDIQDNLLIYYLFLPVTLLIASNTFLAEILVSYKYFSSQLIFNIGLNLTMVIGVCVFHKIYGGASMMLGAFSFVIIHVVYFILFMKRKLHWNFRVFDFSLLKPSLKPIIGLSANQCFVIFVSSFPFYMLSQFHGGSISIVNYAMKLVQTPYSFLQQIALVLQIKLNELHTQRRNNDLYRFTNNIANKMFILGLVIAIFVFLFKYQLVVFLFGLTNIPSNLMTQITTVLSISIFVLPLTSFGQTWAKLYFVKKAIRKYISVVFCVNIISCLIYYIGINSYGITGYAWSYLLAESLMSVILWYRIKFYQ